MQKKSPVDSGQIEIQHSIEQDNRPVAPMVKRHAVYMVLIEFCPDKRKNSRDRHHIKQFDKTDQHTVLHILSGRSYSFISHSGIIDGKRALSPLSFPSAEVYMHRGNSNREKALHSYPHIKISGGLGIPGLSSFRDRSNR